MKLLRFIIIFLHAATAIHFYYLSLLYLLLNFLIMNSRRRFLANSSKLAMGGLALQSFNTKNFSLLKKNMVAADQINIGAIGINGMGWADTTSMLKNPGVNLVALCDVDKNVLDKRMGELQKPCMLAKGPGRTSHRRFP